MQRPPYNSTFQEGHPFSGIPQDPKKKAHRAAVSLALDAGLLPQLAPLYVLAAATAGQVLQAEIQFDDALDSLGRRWQLWFRPPVPADGRLHRLAVSLDGQRVRAPAWLRGLPTAP